MTQHVQALVQAFAPVMRAYVAQTMGGVLARVGELEGQVEGLRTELRTRDADSSAVERIVMAHLAGLPPAPAGKDADPEIVTRLVEAEVQRAVTALPPPRDGADADPDVIKAMVADAIAALPSAPPGRDADPAEIARQVADAVAALPPPAPGKDADPAQIERMVADAVAAIPRPQDGKDADMAALERQVEALVKQTIEALPAAKDGQDADPEVIAQTVAEAVAKATEPLSAATVGMVERAVSEAVAALPVPKDGVSVTVEDVRPLIERAVSDAVAAMPVPKDGVGVAGAVISREGCLVLTLSDGSIRELGQVIGKDVDMAHVERLVLDEMAKIPAPKDGKDGLGFDDLDVVGDGERTVTLRFTRGEVVKEFRLVFPVMVDRGVWKEQPFVRGDGVSFGGAFWIAQRDAPGKPGDTDSGWRLAVKSGRPGKDADMSALREHLAVLVEKTVKGLPSVRSAKD